MSIFGTILLILVVDLVLIAGLVAAVYMANQSGAFDGIIGKMGMVMMKKGQAQAMNMPGDIGRGIHGLGDQGQQMLGNLGGNLKKRA